LDKFPAAGWWGGAQPRKLFRGGSFSLKQRRPGAQARSHKTSADDLGEIAPGGERQRVEYFAVQFGGGRPAGGGRRWGLERGGRHRG